jgi:outer membrane receptor protein involved in Fe transport
MDPILAENYYGCIPGTPPCTPLPPVETPEGTNLPVAPKFKGNIIARYSLTTMGDWRPYAQVSAMYQNETAQVLLGSQAAVVGNLPAYALINLKLGIDGTNGMHMDFFVNNLANRLAELSRYTASNPSLDNQVYILPSQPRTFGIEFGQEF